MAPIVLVRKRATGGGPAPVAPTNTVAPVVTGTATVGELLSTTDGTWSGTPVIAFTYQWQRDGVNIGGATANTYTLVDADYTHAIRAVVTGTNGVGNSSANSNATAAVTRTYAQEVLADSPRGYWKLDETSGTSAADSSGNGLTGTHTAVLGSGVPTPNQTPLISVGKSALYQKVTNTGYTRVPHNVLLNVADTFTIECWAKFNSVGIFQVIHDKGPNSAFFWVNDTNHLLLSKTGVADIVASTTTLSSATTYHLVATKSGATVKLYVNAVDVTGVVTNQTCANTTDVLALGIDLTDGLILPVDGFLDEIAVYPTALSAARVAAHYAAR